MRTGGRGPRRRAGSPRVDARAVLVDEVHRHARDVLWLIEVLAKAASLDLRTEVLLVAMAHTSTEREVSARRRKTRPCKDLRELHLRSETKLADLIEDRPASAASNSPGLSCTALIQEHDATHAAARQPRLREPPQGERSRRGVQHRLPRLPEYQPRTLSSVRSGQAPARHSIDRGSFTTTLPPPPRISTPSHEETNGEYD